MKQKSIFQRFYFCIEREGFFKTLLISLKVLINMILKPIYRNYNSIKGKLSDKVINKPYQVVEVPTNSINECLCPYPHSHILWLNTDSELCRPSISEVRVEKFLFLQKRIVGSIKSGDWDTKRTKFEDQIYYISFNERFLKNKKWEETKYYKLFNKMLQEGKPLRGFFVSWSSFKKKKLKEWEQLYNYIKKHGYKSQDKLKNNKLRKVYKIDDSSNEIEVAVSRKGEILFVDARHRLSIAKILGIKKIPVIVNVWHRDFIDEVKRKTKNKNPTPKDAINYALKKKRK